MKIQPEKEIALKKKLRNEEKKKPTRKKVTKEERKMNT